MSELEKLKQEIKEMQDSMPKILLNPTFAEIQNIESAPNLSIAIDQKKINNADITFTKSENGGFSLVLDNVMGNMDQTYDFELQMGARKFLAENVSVLYS